MSKKIIDLSSGSISDSSLGFIGDPNTGALTRTSYHAMRDYFQSGSAINTSSFVTNTVFNNFSSSYHTDSASFVIIETNQNLSQSKYTLTSSFATFSSSYVTDSSSFDSRIKILSGSFNTSSFVSAITYNVFSASYVIDSSSFITKISNVFASESNYVPTSSFNPFTSSYLTTSQSINVKLNNIFASESNYLPTSSFATFSSSYVVDSSSFNLRINNTLASESNYVPTNSIQGNNNYIAIYSGSQFITFGTLYQSGSSILINGVNGANNALFQVFGAVSINDTSYFLLPRGTTAQRPTGSFGMIRGNSDSSSIEYFNGSQWLTFGNASGSIITGSVTSVGLSLPNIFNVSNSPILGAGVLSASLNTQSANLIFASPSGASGVPTFRALQISDIAALTSSFIAQFLLTSSFNTFSSSYVTDSSSFNNRIINVFLSESNYTPSSSFNTFSSSYSTDSSSFNTRILNVFASESNFTLTASFNTFSSSYVIDSASSNVRFTNIFASESNYLPTSSIQGVLNSIAAYSGPLSLTTSSIFIYSGSILVGVTTSSNAALLQIFGSTYLSGSVYDSTASTGSNGQVLGNAPGGLVWISTGSNNWNLAGNSISSGSFLGTTNAQDLIFKRNNVQVVQFLVNNNYILGNSNNTVTGSNSVVLGGTNNATTTMATVVNGANNTATGNSSVVVGGQNNTVSGIGAVILGGTNLSGISAYSITLGRFNDPVAGSNSGSWVSTDPLLVLGNGSSTSSLSNAVVIYKNGNVTLPAYANTSSAFLSVDSSGSLSALNIFRGPVNYFALFTGGNNSLLTASALSYSGSQIVGGDTRLQNNTSFILNPDSNVNQGQFKGVILAGNNNIATSNGFGAFMAGSDNTASATNVVVEGRFNTVSGQYSHAEGFNNIVIGQYSHAGGIGNVVSGSFQTVLGRYNQMSNTSSLVVIGNGVTGSQRSDLAQFNSSSIIFFGDLTISSSIHISQSIYDSLGSTGSNGQILSSTGIGTQWINISGSSGINGFVTNGIFQTYTASALAPFNTFTSSYATDSGSFNSRINNVFASESNYLPSSSLRGLSNYLSVFSGSNVLITSSVFQSSGSILIGNTTSSNNSLLQVFGNIYISHSIFDSTNSTGSVGQVLSNVGSGIKWINSGSGGTSVLNFIIGDGGPFTPLSGSTQVSASILIGRTILQFFQEGALMSPVSRSVNWYSSTQSQGIINMQNTSFDTDTFYSILYI